MDELVRFQSVYVSGSVDFLLTKEQSKSPDFKGDLFNIGFIPPERIQSYSCAKCEREYEHAPGIEVIVTEFARGPVPSVNYICSECKGIIGFQYLGSPEGIDAKYIVFDETGDFKTPTVEAIEEQLKLAMEDAKEGYGNLDEGGYERSLKQAIKWSEKIGHYIPEETIRGIEDTHRDSYLRAFERDLPELIESIKSHSYAFFDTGQDGEISAYEGTGLYEEMDALFEALPLIDLPDDVELKQDILRILEAYKP
jgi:hypothetical protein